jgi:hypothetical protein
LLLRLDRFFPLVEINHIVIYGSMVNQKIGRIGKNTWLLIRFEQLVDAIATLGERIEPLNVFFFFWKQGFYLIKQSWESITETPD